MEIQFNEMRNTERKGLSADGYSGVESKADVSLIFLISIFLFFPFFFNKPNVSIVSLLEPKSCWIFA